MAVNNIRLKRSAVAGKVPSAADLDLGELAINTHDGKLYLKRDDGTQSIVDLTDARTLDGENPSFYLDYNNLVNTPDGANVPISADPPSSPNSGDLWWDSNEGNLYIYYQDSDSSQWVAATVAIKTPQDEVTELLALAAL